jgi:hypothetical protein
VRISTVFDLFNSYGLIIGEWVVSLIDNSIHSMTDLVGKVELIPIFLNDIEYFNFDDKKCHPNDVLNDSMILAAKTLFQLNLNYML